MKIQGGGGSATHLKSINDDYENLLTFQGFFMPPSINVEPHIE